MRAVFDFPSWPLRAKLAALLMLASVLPLTVAAVIDIRGSKERMIDHAAALLAARGDQLTDQLDAFHRGYLKSIDRFAHLPAVVLAARMGLENVAPDDGVLLSLLGVYPASDAHIRGAALIDRSGRVRVATESNLVGIDLSYRGFTREALRAPGVLIADIHFADPEVGETPTIAYLAPVRGPGGETLGLVALWVKAAALRDVMKASNGLAGPGSFAVLFDNQGIRIAHTYSDEIIFHPGGRLEPAMLEALVAERRFGAKTRALLEDVRAFPEQFDRARAPFPDQGLFRGFAPVNQQWNYGVGRRFRTVPWTVFYMIPEVSFQAPVDHMIRQKIGMSAAILLFALIAGMLLTGELMRKGAALEAENAERRHAEGRLQAQLARLALLNHITRAIAERQDVQSIFQVVIRNIEENLAVDFSCVCLYDPVAKLLTVDRAGVRSTALAAEFATTENAQIEVESTGLLQAVGGQLIYEPDVDAVALPFPQRLARAGLHALVAAPLVAESRVFGLLVVARNRPGSFSSGECEFLKQLGEHVALASNQAQLYDALQRAYDDLRQTQQAMMQQERLRALGQMASGIAHDINNAISPVGLYAEALIADETQLSDRGRRYLQTIQRAVEDVAQTVSRLREFHRQRGPQATMTPIDLDPLVDQVAELTRARWSTMPQKRGVVIELRREREAGDLPPFMGVEGEIRVALTNLIFNAVDAMPEGGVLTLRTRRRAGGREGTGCDRVEIQVADTGVGMSDDTRRRCLEPFFTTKGEGGTGLGLAMVYGTAERHGADFEIDSAPGRGTTVSLLFPVPSAGAATATASDARPARSLRLLVVDDDPLLLQSLRDVLDGDGHEVTTAMGGADAIAAFRAHLAGRPFEVVITDLGMPQIDGRQVASAIKALSPLTPVILLTGWGQRLVAEADIPPHVDLLLNKPPRVREIRIALAKLTG